MIKSIGTFRVSPCLPSSLHRLTELAYNLRWAWHHETRALFRRIDRDEWERSGRNPVAMLGAVEQKRLVEVGADAGFLAHYERACQDLDAYIADKTTTWFSKSGAAATPMRIAYFSAEFAITDCLPIYSGGLAVLAGDHLKSASDLALPLVAVGLLYQQGYFRQYLNVDGWQQEAYSDSDFYTMPIKPVLDANGRELTLRVPVGAVDVVVKVWVAQVGRIPLYLLDTNTDENSVGDRDITDRLYGGDVELRIKQEIILGIGGMRVLEALHITPDVCHMNEGHTAFLALERIRQLMTRHGLRFEEAREVAKAGHVFTTHTPVAAGNDYFSVELVERYLPLHYGALGLNRDQFLALGRKHPSDSSEPFCMTVLALRLASHGNAVSRLHEDVTRRMWADVWPGAPTDEVPVSHVTNAVHVQSWISGEMSGLFDTYIGPSWREQPGDQSAWKWASRIPSEELWRAHERRRERLVAFARSRLKSQLRARGVGVTQLHWVEDVLDPEVLTIGIGRRFATYKRPLLLWHDVERLERLLNNTDRPIQVIYAGKAHPRDEPGKQLIRNLIHLASQPAFRKRVVFLEDYDLDVARYMVQGVDVWLNTPRRYMEASGTSGMKAIFNGALNLSILDSWWDEAYTPEIGWAIGAGESYQDEALQDQVESQALYDLLEKEVAPMFYDRPGNHLPREWVDRIKSAMEELCPVFNTHRMVSEYATRYYVTSYERYRRFTADDFAVSKRLASWRQRVTASWQGVRIHKANVSLPDTMRVGDPITARAWVSLGDLSVEDVSVQFCLGRVNANGELISPAVITLRPEGSEGGQKIFVGETEPCGASGLHGYSVRVLPVHPELSSPWDLGLVRWAT